jgi:hypothetical protein
MEVSNIESAAIEKQVQEKISSMEDLSVSPTIIIEEISRNHKMIHRYKLTKNNITIGRGYDNDIILSDPHICANHIHINFDQGSWKISDQKSINGSFLENPGSKKENADQHQINDGDIISLGKSQLRILFIDHPVTPTVHFSAFESFINLMRHPVALLTSITLFIAIAGSLGYLSSPIESNYSQFFVNAVGMALVFALWPMGVALVSHLTKHDARTMAQLGISFAFFNLMWFSDFVDAVIAFNTASNSLVLFVATLLPIALAFCLFWLNCYIGFHMTAKRRIIVSVGITALLFGGSYLVQYSHKPEFNPRPQYKATIMAPTFLLAPSSSVDEFIKDNNMLFEKAVKTIKKNK